MHVHFQLRAGVAHCGKRCDGRDLAAAQIEAGARIDIAERKLDDIIRDTFSA